MSGIYISGMEMPKSCFFCPMRMKVDPDTIKCLATGERFEETFAGTIEMRNRGNCPLIPVPDHGDLIERKTALDSLMDGMDMTGYQSRAMDCLNEIYVPAIIPADKEEKQ